MKQLVRLLIRLYPANWRERYGEEFEALLEDSSPDRRAILDLLKGAIKMQLSIPAFPKLALVLSIAGILTGLAISFAFRPVYVSEAEMRVGEAFLSSAPSAVHSNPREHLMRMEQEILSRTSLKNIIQDPRLDLYPEERASMPLEDVIEKMRKEGIRIRIDAAGRIGVDDLAFSVGFAYPDRLKAQHTVQALITRFQDANLDSQRKAQMNVKKQRSSDQLDRLQARIAVLEKRLGISPAQPEPGDRFAVDSAGINLDVLDPPSLPVAPVYPDRFRFMFFGFGAGFTAALVIAIFRRRLPPIAFPAQTA